MNSWTPETSRSGKPVLNVPKGQLLTVCTVYGCAGSARVRGLCQSHYDRWRYHGDPQGQNQDIARHGFARSGQKTPEWTAWTRMKTRCLNPGHPAFKDYGGRGITVCERWMTFENFIADMGRRPSNKHSIDRINNDGNYEPSNCRWATRKEQANNRRSSRFLTFEGRTLSCSEWCIELSDLNLTSQHIYQRLQMGWSPERILTTPVRQITRRQI
jgi:hypothetical protein